jgi:hypothetical protein
MTGQVSQGPQAATPVTTLFGAPIAHEDHAQRACYSRQRSPLRRLTPPEGWP